MRFLLDACVLSEVRHPSGSAKVKNAIAQIDDQDLFMSALTVGEIRKGIELLPIGEKRSELTFWLSRQEKEFSERLLPIDRDISTVWGIITARLQRAGITLPVIDGLIAATAIHHGMHLITRNTKHVEDTGVLLFDPWQV